VAKYAISIKPSAAKELDRLTDALFARIDARILALADNPRPAGCTKLKGHADLWRIRIGDYRVVYAIDDAASRVDVLRVGHRREVYQQ
jgi:mRNA interferase RelE/StbE